MFQSPPTRDVVENHFGRPTSRPRVKRQSETGSQVLLKSLRATTPHPLTLSLAPRDDLEFGQQENSKEKADPPGIKRAVAQLPNKKTQAHCWDMSEFLLSWGPNLHLPHDCSEPGEVLRIYLETL